MSKLYADISSQPRSVTTTKTQRGHSWIRTHTRTWKHGITVHYYYDSSTDSMNYEVQITGGSNDPETKKLIASGVIKDWK